MASFLNIVIYLFIYFIYDILYTSQLAYLLQNAKTVTLPVALHAMEQSLPLELMPMANDGIAGQSP